jgi:hypothetical protein
MERLEAAKAKSRLTTEDVGMIFITITVNGAQVFSFWIGADGLFSRIGTGELRPHEEQVCCGTVTRELFRRVTAGITADLVRWKGIHRMPVQKGKACELFMAILFKGGQQWITRWNYGADSDGPPPEICTFMRRAIDLTDPRPDRPPLQPTRTRIEHTTVIPVEPTAAITTCAMRMFRGTGDACEAWF